MRPWLAALAVLTSVAPAPAGLYSSLEPTNPLPAKWRGFLPDHRTLRMVAADPAANVALPPSALREAYADLALTLDTASKGRRLTATEAADLGAAFVRLGQAERAVGVLRTARRNDPDDFRLAANLGTARQLAGDLAGAVEALTEAVRLAPETHKKAERAHLDLVKRRLKDGKVTPDSWDDLFGSAADYDRGKVPADAAAVVQQLCLWLPADGRLLWQLAEIAKATGDVRTAANILDGCVAEFGMASPNLRARRAKYRAEADALAKAVDHTAHAGTLAFASARPLGSTFDASKLPAVKADRANALAWPALGETTVGKGFTPKFLKYVESLDGLRVTLVGYPAPSGDADDGAFLLTEYPIGCWFCETPDATGIVRVRLEGDGDATGIPKGVIKLTGTFRLNRTDPERFLFHLEGARRGVTD
jgi:tetratricopeptide (TPR) repeat protein